MGNFSQYKVNLAAIPEGHYEQDFVCDSEFFRAMECDGVVASDVAVHMDVEHRHGAYECLFTLKGRMSIPCDRCLDPMEHPVDTDYRLTVRFGDEYSDENEGTLTIPQTDNTLDVAPLLYDTLMLTIPIRHVHRPGECNAEMTEHLRQHTSGDETADEEE